MNRPTSVVVAVVEVLAIFVVFGLFGGGLSSCGRGRHHLATIIDSSGTVETQHADAWAAGAVGAKLVEGDALRTAARSTARVRMNNGGTIRVLENTRLRFTRGTIPTPGTEKAHGQHDDIGLALELGSAEVESSTEQGVAVSTTVGPARLAQGSRVRLHAQGGKTTVEVIVGRAVLLRSQGEVAVNAGDAISVGIGDAEVERFKVSMGRPIIEPQPDSPAPRPAESEAPAPHPGRPPQASAAATSASTPPTQPPRDEPAPSDLTANGGGQVVAVLPAVAVLPVVPGRDGRADVTLVAGDSGILHDLKLPLSVRIRFDQICPDGGILETGKTPRIRKVSGAGALVLRLGGGAHRYRLRCASDGPAEKPRAAGVLIVKRDSGNVPLPRRAPSTAIEADGRRYTVLFQTRLPELTFAWSHPPKGASSLTLHVQSSKGAEVFRSTATEQRLRSGALPEGTYTCWFATDDGRTSPKTTLTIRFDNTAPTAQFLRADGAAVATTPGAIPIDGVTVAGATVSVAGAPVAVDNHGRFRAAALPLAGDDAVAVRLEHPRTGIHYYVRRAEDAH